MLGWLLRFVLGIFLARLLMGSRNSSHRPETSPFSPPPGGNRAATDARSRQAAPPRPDDIVDGEFEELPVRPRTR